MQMKVIHRLHRVSVHWMVWEISARNDSGSKGSFRDKCERKIHEMKFGGNTVVVGGKIKNFQSFPDP